MNFKKWLVYLGVFSVLLGTVLTGCSNGASSSNDDSGDSSEEVTLQMSGWGSTPIEEELLNETLAAFEEEHPNINVEFDVIADQYMDVLKTRLIGGQAADVFFLDALEAPALMSKGVLEPLDKYVTDEFDIEDFQDPLLNAFKHDGKYYGFPKDFSTLALFYNEKAFKEAGLEGPPESWKELREYAEKLTVDKNGDGDPEQYGLGISKELARQFFKLKPYGAQLTNEEGKATFATDSAVQALTPLVEMYQDDKTAALPSDVGADWGGDMLGTGKAAMVVEGNWTIPFLENNFKDLNYNTAQLPTLNGKKATAAFTVAYVMNKQSEKKEAAWELISFLTGKEGMKIWTSKGLALPTRESVAKELGFADSKLRAPFVEGASYAQPWQAGKHLPIIMNNFNNQFISALLGEQSLKEALEQAQKTANDEIEASN
ncbi:ABC transporter substrate-binding protein [Halobacillus hunanensis]|uniref:ABC transporter substrate-binding protein n=1 Tax=Halobacillus hunanensis TaxID=578214 RepID=UPI0009A7F20C|nr:ABC transporter substrate-binding protein [Halobacillus hunanensis]